ncbi:pyridoxal-phosphate dependent enzyme [Streptomyces sp. NPDC090083]|uniref:threonine synthase n=1 Tax=Streptomyces sp. NPDC090083 TaxID=3365941 RepID=UPI00380C05FB
MNNPSLAVHQRSLGDPAVTFPLWPPITDGCPRTSTGDIAFPVEVDYAYDKVDRGAFGIENCHGLERWAPLLPPLLAPGLGEGATPMVEIRPGVWVKDESRNPTWSHKDRLNRCTLSAAVGVGAPGVVVASSGNHGASAAAYAARAGLRCIVIVSAGAPPAVMDFIRAYGAVVVQAPIAARAGLLRRIVTDLGYHPVSNVTPTHTGHAFGPEGYKTIAYEIHRDIGTPSAIFVPTGYGELLFGVWKGFRELSQLGIAEDVPRIFACETASGGPLGKALAAGRPTAAVTVRPSAAYAINCAVNSYRGVIAVRESQGQAILVDDDEMHKAQAELAGSGLWAETSSAAALAGLRQYGEQAGQVVCISTSSGFKDIGVGTRTPPPDVTSWDEVRAHLRHEGISAT